MEIITPSMNYKVSGVATGIDSPDDATNRFKFYQQNKRIFISGEDFQPHTLVKLYTLTGETVLSEEINHSEASIDIHHLKSGVYIINIIDGYNNQSRKVIIN